MTNKSESKGGKIAEDIQDLFSEDSLNSGTIGCEKLYELRKTSFKWITFKRA